MTSGPIIETDMGLTREEVFSILSNRRRRFALHALCQRDDEAELGWLANRVAAWEQGISPAEVDSNARKSCYVSLQQSHLPRMDDAGVVEFDKRAGTVYPTDSAEKLDVYLEVVPGQEVPWHGYYLGLGTVSVALLLALWVDAPPFTLLPDLIWGVFLVTALLVSALVHTYLARKQKVGSDGPPPEVQR
jgi:hypothetical protein